LEYINYVKADNKALCCVAKHVEMCVIPQAISFDCHYLLQCSLLRYIMWSTGIIELLLNIPVIIYHITCKKLNNDIDLLILNMSFSDSLMIVYFLSICIVDANFYGIYGIKSLLWENNPFCKVLSSLAIISLEASLMFACLIQMFYSIRIKKHEKVELGKAKMVITVCCVWLLACVFGGLSVLSLDQPLTNGLCISLGFNSFKEAKGWYFIILLIFNFTLTVVLLVCGFKIIGIVVVSARNIQKHGNVFGKIMLHKTISIILASLSSYVVCWITLDILIIGALCNFKLEEKIIQFIIVCFTPLSSLCNPCLYIIRHVKLDNLIKRNGNTTQK